MLNRQLSKPTQKKISSSSLLLSFVVPKKYAVISKKRIDLGKVVTIVPTYKPDAMVKKLISDLVKWNKIMRIIVVDDSSPAEFEPVFDFMKNLSERVSVLRTPNNKMKSGAINMALGVILNSDKFADTQVIVTMDDDITINQQTVKKLIGQLIQDASLGLVCSRAAVRNKNQNLLTRIQGLEYHGFNITRLADEGFFYGPLVMHGMLMAFKKTTIKITGGLKENHLIEDYELTMRVKQAGFRVKGMLDALAWTEVPARLSQLWRQRVRWMYGGMYVLTSSKGISFVIQDFLGHAMFLSSFVLIIISLFLKGGAPGVYQATVNLFIVVTIASTGIWYIFQLWNMRFYQTRDKWDWVLRISLIPEFIYANLMTLNLLGCYLFFAFNQLEKLLSKIKYFQRVNDVIFRLFRKLGYSNTWGTR